MHDRADISANGKGTENAAQTSPRMALLYSSQLFLASRLVQGRTNNLVRGLRHLLAGFAILAGTAAYLPAHAQSYPSKIVTIVVPFAAGSGTDLRARALAQAIHNESNARVIVDPKPGASGFIASQYVAKAAPDGYTVLLTTNTTHAANEHLYKKLPYDPVRDFTPVMLLSKGYMLLLVNPKSPAQTLGDLLELARRSPGKINFGSGSSSSRVAGELLRQMTAIEVVHVPYKSNPNAITDLLGGQIDFMFADASTALPQVIAGKLRALAASGARRLGSAPSVPTVEEAGVPGYDMSYWNAIYLPAGATPEVTRQVREMFLKASASAEIAAYLARIGEDSAVSTPEGLARFQANESQKWGRVIRAAGIEPE
jgi:tripartite-type tricarboxylate transporter receptor subunit TctC